MDVWDKPAAACLSSRIPYGTSVTRERLAQIGGFEAELKALGFRQVRVRWHDKIARIEVDLAELPRLLEPGVREKVVERRQAPRLHLRGARPRRLPHRLAQRGPGRQSAALGLT